MSAVPAARAVVTQAAQSHGIDPAILWGVLGTETNYGEDDKTSSAGAQGYFQLEPATARSLGVKNPNDFAEAANGAAKYLAEYKSRGVGGMLSAYNAGPAGGYQAGYVNETLQNAKSYGSNIAVPSVSREPTATAAALPKATGSTRVSVPNANAKGLDFLAAERASEGEGLLANALEQRAQPTSVTLPRTSAAASTATATGVPVTAESAGTTSLKLPGAPPAPSIAARNITPPLPRAVATAKAALESAQHRPVSVPELSKDLGHAEAEGKPLVRNAPVVAEAPNGKVVKTPKGPVYVPKNPFEQISGNREVK
jgi:hypothetical protein